MESIPDARPLSRSEHHEGRRVQRKESRRERARWARQGFMSITGFSTMTGTKHSVLIGSVQIIGYEEQARTKYFRIRCCSVGTGSRQWDVIRRYTDFFNLRESLGVLDKRVGSMFPKKTWFAAKDSELGHRVRLWQPWLNGLLNEFATGGDGRNALIPIARQRKLIRLHRFLGIDLEGNLLPHSVLVGGRTVAPPVAVATSVVAPVVLVNGNQPVTEVYPVNVLAQQALAIAVPSAPLMATIEDEQLQLKAAEEQQLRSDVEAIRLMEEEESEEKDRVAHEEAKEERRKADDERKRVIRAAEEAARKQAEEDERVRAAGENPRIRAEEVEAARLAAEEANVREAEEACVHAEVAEAAGLKSDDQEEDDEKARIAAEKLASLNTESEKSWLQRAVEMEKEAREIEAAGRYAEALQAFRNTVEVYKVVIKNEQSLKIQQAVATRCDDLSRHADKLWENLAAAQLASVAASSRLSVAVAANSAMAAPAAVPAGAVAVAPRAVAE